LTNPILYGILRYNQETETTGAHDGLGDIPLKVSVIGTKTMKKNLTNTERPVKPVWAKYIATLEKHAAKKKRRYAHKIELKNFDLAAFID